MEGVDNEEVGINEVWEGVGSTTLGGIEWHWMSISLVCYDTTTGECLFSWWVMLFSKLLYDCHIIEIM